MAIWLAGLLDLFGEPPNWTHPVAGFGALAGALERRFYRDSAWRGGSLALAAQGALFSALEGPLG